MTRVLITGAGASANLGLPLGSELLALMRSPLNTFCEVPDCERDVQAQDDSLCRVAYDISFSSVDALLRHRDDLRPAAMLKTASIILNRQARFHFERHDRQEWQARLFDWWIRDRCHSSSDWLEESRDVTIVTFNYDMTIELEMARRLRAHLGVSKEEAWGLACRLPVVHVHGHIDPGPHIVDNLDSLPGAPILKYNLDAVRRATAQFRTVWDKNSNSDCIDERVASALNECTHVMFFGFGFLNENVQRAGLEQIARRGMRCITTGILGDAARRRVRELLPNSIIANPGTTLDSLIDVFFRDEWDVLDYERDTTAALLARHFAERSR